MRPAQRALIILDMINTFDFPGGAVLCRRALPVAPAIAKLKDKVKCSGGHCLYVNDNFSQWQSNFRELVAKAEAGPGRAIVERLKPRDDDSFVLKPKHSAFFQTPLKLLLEQLQARTLVLAGIAGYFAGVRKREKPDFPAAVFAAMQSKFGDLDVDSPGHHGTPAERGAAIVKGFEAAYRQKLSLADTIVASTNYVTAL